MITLLESLLSETLPHIRFVEFLGHIKRDGQVTAFDSQIEAGGGILHEVKGDFRVPLLLQIRNDALPNQIGVSDDLQNLVVVLLDQGELETVLSRVDLNGSWSRGTVQAVDSGSLDSSEVDGLLQRLDNTVVAKSE